MNILESALKIFGGVQLKYQSRDKIVYPRFSWSMKNDRKRRHKFNSKIGIETENNSENIYFEPFLILNI